MAVGLAVAADTTGATVVLQLGGGEYTYVCPVTGNLAGDEFVNLTLLVVVVPGKEVAQVSAPVPTVLLCQFPAVVAVRMPIIG